MNQRDRREIISKLLADTAEFEEAGRASALLQQYFDGLPLDSLRSLLRHQDAVVQRVAVFVAAELGARGSVLIDDVIPLISSQDRSTAYDAIVALTACTDGVNAARFEHVIRSLENVDVVLRRLSMRMVSWASASKLQATKRRFATFSRADNEHRAGLTLLLDRNRFSADDFRQALGDDAPLLRRYAAIAAVRSMATMPQLLEHAAHSDDVEIRTFADDMLHRKRSMNTVWRSR